MEEEDIMDFEEYCDLILNIPREALLFISKDDWDKKYEMYEKYVKRVMDGN
jgi:hypothetical protein